MNTYNITYTTDSTLGAHKVEVEALTPELALCEMYELGFVQLDGSDNFEYTIEAAENKTGLSG